MSDSNDSQVFTIRRKIFTLFSSKFHVYNPQGEVIGFSKQKAFKLKEDIRIYTDESMTEERLFIQARNIIDFSASYDVVDSLTHEKVGALRRKGFSSILRDSWEFLDPSDEPIGHIVEDSMAMLRRFLSNLIPQKFHAAAGDQTVANYRQHFNPFVYKLTVTIEPDANDFIDTRLLLAGGILLAAIEGRQK